MFASALLALGLLPAAAGAQVQGRQVSGRVTRTLGDVPVVGATVVEVGGPGVAQTGNDGTFLPTEISLHALSVGEATRILGLVQDRSEHREPAC